MEHCRGMRFQSFHPFFRNRRYFSELSPRRSYPWVLGSLFFLAAPLFFQPIQRELWTKLVIDDTDDSFPWLLQWLHSIPYSKECLHLSTISAARNEAQKILSNILTGSETTQIRNIQLIPAFGTHYFIFEGKLMWVTYAKDQNEAGIQKSLTVNILGRDRAYVEHLIQFAQKEFLASKSNKTTIFIPGNYNIHSLSYSLTTYRLTD